MSEHCFGIALDIAITNGASVTKNWGKNTEKGQYLKKVNEVACSITNKDHDCYLIYLGYYASKRF